MSQKEADTGKDYNSGTSLKGMKRFMFKFWFYRGKGASDWILENTFYI